ncbi:unnamed protein product [Hydatigera taeniaeformis]|uniref:Uncharacterized protein n=1 Tax=Hydatigena taeniaeformis TaxID=6205 RepID=A0A0R3XA76_HYDTA|nr:unnamed protein product [Hydatigera taeniaeformis]
MSHLLTSPDITPPPSSIHPPHTFQCHMLSPSLPPSLPPSPPPPPQAPHARITTNSTFTLASPHIRWSQSDDKPHTTPPPLPPPPPATHTAWSCHEDVSTS